MNRDHGDAVALYAARLLHQEGVGWRMTGIDPEGMDLF
jgi:heme iron utilization protein